MSRRKFSQFTDCKSACHQALSSPDACSPRDKSGLHALGWTFITQEIGALDSQIYTQLTVRAFGCGLTSGGDLNRIRDEIGRGSGLELYMSFPDPRALTEKQYPFMITGPVSPLSFTSAPVFLEVFTSEEQLLDANRNPRGHTRRSDNQ